MKSGLKNCVLSSLSKEEMRDFMPKDGIKDKPSDHEAFLQYAKQREILSNIDKKLDYHAMQKDRHPYINDLRAAMQRKRSSNPSNDYDSL